MLAGMNLTRLASVLALGGAVLSTAVLAGCGSDSSAAESIKRVGLMHVGLDHVPPSLQGIADGLAEHGWTVPAAEVEKCSKELQANCDFRGDNIELIWRNLDKDQAQTQADAFVPVESRRLFVQPASDGAWASDHFGLWVRLRRR